MTKYLNKNSIYNIKFYTHFPKHAKCDRIFYNTFKMRNGKQHFIILMQIIFMGLENFKKNLFYE